MPIYDYYCNDCKIVDVDRFEKHDAVVLCPECNEPMKRACNCSHFKLVYNNKTDTCNWHGESSQYWKQYKEAKANGHDVKPFGED